MPLDFSPLANPFRAALQVMADVIAPPPPVDLNAWAAANVEFGSDSPLPGPYDPAKFAFFKRPLEVLSPDHPARVVVMKKSAQLGGTVLGQIFLGGTMDLDPGPFLYTHPTEPNGIRWVKTKWKPFARAIATLRRLFTFDRSRDGGNSLMYQERRDGRGWLQVSGANSEASLSMISVSRQVQDDLAKWQLNSAGDPEAQADSRSQAFEWAKIFKCGTPLLWPGCRVTKAFNASTQEHYHVPCPHCGFEHALDWENMLANLDEAQPEKAHFSCPDCGGVIEQKHRQWMVERGRWVAHNPGASVVGFYLWSAYSPLQSWARIAEAWINAKGDPAKEQTFLNDVVGRAYEQAGEAPEWEKLRDRANASELEIGVVPTGALLLTIGVDCQIDRVEWHLKGWGRELRRWTIEYGVVPGHISDPATRHVLDGLLKRSWPDSFGNRRIVDMLAIDGGNWKNDVMDWAKAHPQERVIVTRGAKSDTAPDLVLVKHERNRDGKVVRYQKRFWNLGVSALKAALYSQLRKPDPLQRGFCAFPAGLDDEFYRQLCSERRKPVKTKTGYEEYRWVKDDGVNNEVLDTELIAEGAAVRLGWKRMKDADFDRLAAQREKVAETVQQELFEPNQAKAADEPLPPPVSLPLLGSGQSRRRRVRSKGL